RSGSRLASAAYMSSVRGRVRRARATTSRTPMRRPRYRITLDARSQRHAVAQPGVVPEEQVEEGPQAQPVVAAAGPVLRQQALDLTEVEQAAVAQARAPLRLVED